MLRAQAAKRLAVVSLVMVFIASMAGAVVFMLVVSTTAKDEAKTVETFYANKLREWDEDWERESVRQSARLDFMNLAANPEGRFERLSAYFIAQGEDPPFSQTFLIDSGNRPLFWYGTDSKRLAGLVATAPDPDWFYDECANTLYRVYHQTVWLGRDGVGRMVTLRILDNALLYLNTSSRTDLRLEWQGRQVAESLRSQRPDYPVFSPARISSQLPWPGGKSPAPVLMLSHIVAAPIGTPAAAAAVALLLGAQALCIWVVLGRWLVQVGRRVSLLDQASGAFAQGWAVGRGAPMALAPEVTAQDDEIAGVARSLVDLTEAVASHDAQRLASQDELRRLRNLLSDIVDSMPSALITVDMQGRITQCNQRASAVSGFREEEAVGKQLEDVFPRLAGEVPRLADAMLRRESWVGHKLPWTFANETRYEDVTIYPLSGHAAAGAVIRLDDVTDRQRMEQMIIQSEKMLSVGGLAAGMAHEINNPLGGILQSAQVINRRISAELPENRRLAGELGCTLEAVRGYLEGRGILTMLDGITDSARRAARIVTDMLEFSRQGESPMAPVDLRHILDKAIELSSKDYNVKRRFDFRKIHIEKHFDQDLPPVPCSATQIEQVLMNLLRNAAQAMEGNPPDNPPKIILRARRDGNDVHLEVEDNGPGLDEAVRRRMFEPFYTTKPPGVGSGLGLSVSYFIIAENHGGNMSVESEPGRWTRFHVRLPITPKKAGGQTTRSEPSA
jgi:PAS domain S-box-containing protein